MIPKITLLTLAAGIAAGIIFALAAYSAAGGLLLIYLPTFPLLLIGFHYGARRATFASIAAFITVSLTTDLGNAVFFAAFTVLPTIYFITRALHWRGDDHDREWYPILAIIAELAAVASAFLLLCSIAVAQNAHTTLQALATQELTSSLSGASPDFVVAMKWLISEGSFLLFASTGWLWVMMVYVAAVFANKLLGTYTASLRPSLAITPRGLPWWLLGFLCVNGAFAAFGEGNDRFIAEAVLLLLLLPYFMAGLAQVHTLSRQWRHKRLWLGLFYVALLFQAWLIACVAAIGLFGQIAEMLDKPRQIG